tara:strand:+ start:174 stop:368 length:195 start_codon:yes stop_codon:yes gene_type:complete
MELGLGVLQWTPSEFWSATTHELTAALNGYVEKEGGGKSTKLTAEDVDDLQDLLDAALREEGRL